MHKRKRVVLYGRSVLLGAVSTSLCHYPDLEVIDLSPPLPNVKSLHKLHPDAIIYDLDAITEETSAFIISGYPDVTVIGISPTTDQMLLGAAVDKRAFEILDLVNEIRAKSGAIKNNSERSKKLGKVPIQIEKHKRSKTSSARSGPQLTLLGLAWRNLFTHPGRTILSIIGISLGVAAVLATNITNHNVSATLDRLFERTLGGVELQVMPLERNQTVKESVLGIVKHFPGVELAVPIVSTTTILPANDSNIGEDQLPAELIELGGLTIKVVGIDPIPEQKMRVYTLIEGSFPTTGKYQAVIPLTFSEQNDLQLGDNLRLFGPDGTVSLKICGILADEGAATNNWGNVVFIPLDVVQDIFSLGRGYNEISIKTTPEIGNDPRALDELKSGLAARIIKYADVIYPSGRGDQVPRMSSAYRFSLTFFSIMAVFMGAFLIYNTFMTTVFERTQEIGVLRAIGMYRRQVIHQILYEAGFLSLLGCAIGLLLGVILSRGLMTLMRGFFEVESVSLFTFEDVIISLGVGIIGTLSATLLPARKAARTSPVDSLTIRSQTDKKANPLIWKIGLFFLLFSLVLLYIPLNGSTLTMLVFRMTALIMMLMGAILTIPLIISVLQPMSKRLSSLIYGEMGSIGAMNVQRAVIRTMVTIAALVIALIMIVEVNSLVHILKQDVSEWLNNALGADLIVRSPYPMQLSFAHKLQNIQGVEATSPTRLIRIRVGGQSRSPDRDEWLFFMAIEPDQYRQIGDKEFIAGQADELNFWSQLENGNSLFISSVVAEMFEIGQGDFLTLRTRRGEEDFKVTAVTTEFDQDGLIVTGTYDTLRRMFGESGADFFLVKVSPGYDINQVAEQVKYRYEKSEGIQVQSSMEFRNNVMGFYDQLTSLFNVLSWLGVIIGTIGLINTMTMNVLERKHELAMLRAQGCLRRQVARMVLAEALIIGMISALYGIFFGFVLSHSLVTAANLISGHNLHFVVSSKPYFIIISIALGVSQLATLIPARKASRFNIIEGLKQE